MDIMAFKRRAGLGYKQLGLDYLLFETVYYTELKNKAFSILYALLCGP